jgi:hypothetical protein
LWPALPRQKVGPALNVLSSPNADICKQARLQAFILEHDKLATTI